MRTASPFPARCHLLHFSSGSKQFQHVLACESSCATPDWLDNAGDLHESGVTSPYLLNAYATHGDFRLEPLYKVSHLLYLCLVRHASARGYTKRRRLQRVTEIGLGIIYFAATPSRYPQRGAAWLIDVEILGGQSRLLAI